jgi:hypothetical protein
MPRRNDYFRGPITGDPARYLWDRTPAQSWYKPDRVTLSTQTILLGDENSQKSSMDAPFSRLRLLAELVAPSRPKLQQQVSALEFVQDPHWRESATRTNPVRPHPVIFERFLRLADAPDHEIHEFASRFGALLVFCRIDLLKVPGKFVIIESCDVWRYFAASMRCLLSIANCFHSDRRPDPADWARIGACPASLVPAKSEAPDLLSPYGFGAEEAWAGMAHFVGKGSDRDRKMWTRLLNVLLELGRVRPWLLWERSAGARPELVFTGPSLLSYLALQLCLRASKHDGFAVCSYCHRQYAPAERAPKAGQRNFCPDCRARGVPIRMAQRSRRERLRGKRLGT